MAPPAAADGRAGGLIDRDVLERARGVDLLALVGRDTALKRVASTRGGEWAGPCPLCGGGVDRLRVQPAQGLWWCRGCSRTEHWQDAIAYVVERDRCPFPEAVRTLVGGPAFPDPHHRRPPLRPAPPSCPRSRSGRGRGATGPARSPPPAPTGSGRGTAPGPGPTSTSAGSRTPPSAPGDSATRTGTRRSRRAGGGSIPESRRWSSGGGSPSPGWTPPAGWTGLVAKLIQQQGEKHGCEQDRAERRGRRRHGVGRPAAGGSGGARVALSAGWAGATRIGADPPPDPDDGQGARLRCRATARTSASGSIPTTETAAVPTPHAALDGPGSSQRGRRARRR